MALYQSGPNGELIPIAQNGVSELNWNLKANVDSPTFTGTPTAPTAAAGANTTQIASTAFVAAALAALADSAPETLNTLNELAAALGDDPNFATTVTNLIAAKQAKRVYVSSLVDNTVTVADNTNYTFTGVTAMTVTFPAGDFECLIDVTTGASISITFPAGTKYLNSTPTFEASKRYEISIRNGVVGVAEVV